MNVIWVAIAAVGLLDLALGAILSYTSRRFTMENDPVVEEIDEILPQSQCGQYGYPGYRPYVGAISCNDEKINRYTPGGGAVMLKITGLLNVELQPLNGEAQGITPARTVAIIDENNCIGCAKCIQAYPADAIVGATRAIYTVMSDLCTDCNLCVDPYPTHCISLQPTAETPDSWRWDLNTIFVRTIPVERHT